MQRKIIHVDMDCFFAAIEMRDNPALRNKPVAVGGKPEQRGVLATCNYLARKYGLHSAMASARALRLCPKLVLIPVHMEKYKAVSKVIYRIFKQYTPLVEMLSLDEAFLDVTHCEHCHGSATLIAKTIKQRIKKELNLTASAGVATNKFLAKVASEWNKPDSLFVITPEQVDAFLKQLPVTKIFGVGQVTAKKLHAMQVVTCEDLQQISLEQLVAHFGKMGARLYELSRGIDHRPVEPDRVSKSLSVEETFAQDLESYELCVSKLPTLIKRLNKRLQRVSDLIIYKQFVKIKFADFKRTTIETTTDHLDEELFTQLLQIRWQQWNKSVRLIGVGVRFKNCHR
ncbi:MAG: DNA polymerase IV [Gammaproteobacteria bacterium]|nr:DNA polymerase IV [Gammaproteobacteria bacterium]